MLQQTTQYTYGYPQVTKVWHSAPQESGITQCLVLQACLQFDRTKKFDKMPSPMIPNLHQSLPKFGIMFKKLLFCTQVPDNWCIFKFDTIK